MLELLICYSCGGDIGMFFLVKRSLIVLLHNENGNYMNPPYLDAHGEVDIGLRRGNPLYLNKRRYNELRKLWLSHSGTTFRLIFLVPSAVARKIEQTFDFGGWQTVSFHN